MSHENVEIVLAAVDAANRGDYGAAFKDAAPNFEWDSSRAIGLDNRGIFSLAAAQRMFAEMRALFESSWIEIDEAIPVGDHVVVPHTTHARGRDGIEVKARTTWLFTIRDGKIERVCLYQERQEALEAAGLED
jgi:ketosteroid isomerase-like protein